jgi:hypothetical protein
MWKRRNQPDEARPTKAEERTRLLEERQREYSRELAEEDRRRAKRSVPPPRTAA